MFGITKDKNGNDKNALPAALPPVDVFENEKEFLLVLDLPGVAQGAAGVTIEGEKLVVEGTGASRRFRRELGVPPSIDADKVEATMKGGVLTVHMPKRAPYQPRQIHVRAS